MDGTIAFDHKVSFAAIEVRNVIAELMLPPEFESKDLSIAKQLPQELLGRRLLLSELASESFLTRDLKATAIVSAFSHRDLIIASLASKRFCMESFSLLPFGRRAGDEGLASGIYFSYLSSPGGEWHSKTKISSEVAAVGPHPNPLPMGEGDKNLLPSPIRRRAGDEGLRGGIYFLILFSVGGEWHSTTKGIYRVATR
jgi:hypothetical protein